MDMSLSQLMPNTVIGERKQGVAETGRFRTIKVEPVRPPSPKSPGHHDYSPVSLDPEGTALRPTEAERLQRLAIDATIKAWKTDTNIANTDGLSATIDRQRQPETAAQALARTAGLTSEVAFSSAGSYSFNPYE